MERRYGQHPMIRALILSLPEPGAAWAQEDREKWVAAALAAFEVAYEHPNPEPPR